MAKTPAVLFFCPIKKDVNFTARIDLMYAISESEFNKFVATAIDAVPDKYQQRLASVAVVVEDEPSQAQLQAQKIGPGRTLLGLYEGVPLTHRGNGYSGVLPDKITLFKKPIESISQDLDQLIEQINHTLWHEVAHFFGLDHIEIAKKDIR